MLPAGSSDTTCRRDRRRHASFRIFDPIVMSHVRKLDAPLNVSIRLKARKKSPEPGHRHPLPPRLRIETEPEVSRGA